MPDYSDNDLYLSWPFATRYTQDTLQPQIIEAQADFMLSRAISIRRAVAFVGAGVSMSYGRISWQGLVRSLVERTLKRWLTYLAGPHQQDNHNHIVSLSIANTLQSLRLDQRSDIQPDRYPMMFELCEKLDERLDVLSNVHQTVERPFRRMTAALTKDERGHARVLLSTALEASLPNSSDFEAELNKYFSGEHNYGYYSLFNTLAIRRLASSAHIPPLAKPLTQAVTQYIDACDNLTIPPRYLLPTKRFVFAQLLLAIDATNRVEELRSAISGCEYRLPEPPLRHDVIPGYRDPLAILHDRLGVRKFITTNYDSEIEKLFRDQRGDGIARVLQLANPGLSSLGFPRPPHTVVFTGEDDTIGQLVTFAADAHSGGPSIVHLHGVATDTSTNSSRSMIVTETDYQHRYVSSNDSRTPTDDAIRLTFSANPIIFIGSNMGEDDILRPLREFVSSPNRARDRQLIAIIPAMRSMEKQVEEKIALLGRYGVHAIHFGLATVTASKDELAKARSRKERDRISVRWLPEFWGAKSTIETALDPFLARGFIDAHVGTSREVRENREALQHGLKAALRHLRRTAQAPLVSIGGAEYRIWDNSKAFPALIVPNSLDGIDADLARGLDLILEVGTVNACLEFAHLISEELSTASISRDLLSRYASLAAAHKVALTGAGDSVLAAFTCARLIRAHWNADSWGRDWFKLPSSISIATTDDKEDVTGLPPGSIGPDVLVRRHALMNPTHPSSNAVDGRFYASAPTDTFEELLLALEDNDLERDHKVRDADGRRIFLLVAHPGAGRGHLFGLLQISDHGSALDRFLNHIAKLEVQQGIPGRTRPVMRWATAAFYNLSYSHEAMSVFDRITELLFSTYKRLAKEKKIRAENGWLEASQKLERDRLGLLRFALNIWSRVQHISPDGVQDRILIAINSIHLLYDQDGSAKNGQIMRLMSLLFSEKRSSAPIDLLLFCQDTAIPGALKGGSAALNPIRLERKEPSVTDQNERRIYESRTGVTFDGLARIMHRDQALAA